MQIQTKDSHQAYAYLIISLCACFLFYKYILQIYPSIITESLMREFHLSGAGLGNLAATFYYAFMITQLFVGIMLDKYSARWITTGAIFCCALGVLLFSESYSLTGAALSRALMGVGVAFATVSYLKLASVWVPARHYAFFGGLLASAAMAGAVCGEAPLSWLITQFGWRECLWMIGIAGMILTFLFAVLVRDNPPSATIQKKVNTVTFNDIMTVLKNKQNWLLTLYGGLAFSPLAVFGGLWGNPFSQQAYHLDKMQASSVVSLVFVGLGIGSPVIGVISDKLGDRRQLMFYCTLLSAFSIGLVLYAHPMPIWLMAFLLFSFGFLLGAFVLVFTIGKELNSLRLTATVIAMINASDAILDAITEPGIGKLLDVNWDGKIVNGVHYFSLYSYHWALLVLPVYLISAALLLWFIKDYGQQGEIVSEV